MTHSERTRFAILIVILVILVAAALVIDRFRRSDTEVGADILGVIQNQAAATFKDVDGIELSSLSDISQLTVASGTSNLTLTYKLQSKPDQTTTFDIQFYRPTEDTPLTSIADKRGEAGTVLAKLKNIANGTYDISVKPKGYLSQVLPAVAYANGKATKADFSAEFLACDIDKSNTSKGDNKVNTADTSIVLQAWNGPSDVADFNGDGFVNSLDLSICLENFNKTGSRFVPVEPVDSAALPPEL